MKLIEENPYLTWKRTRRLFARLVNELRTSDARIQKDGGMIIDRIRMYRGDAGHHPFGNFSIHYSWGRSSGVSHVFYSTLYDVILELEVFHENPWRPSDDQGKNVKAVMLTMSTGKPIPKEDPGYIQRVVLGSELCSIQYMFCVEKVARKIKVGEITVSDFGKINPSLLCPAVNLLLKFADSVIEQGISYGVFLEKEQVRFSTDYASKRKVGWKRHVDVTV